MRRPLGVTFVGCTLLVSQALISCGDGEKAPSETATAGTASPTTTEAATDSPTPSPTATEVAEADGEDGFRAFALRVETALAASDGSFFADLGIEEDLVCTGEEELGICAGEPVGTAFRGIPRGIFQTDAFALTSPVEYADDLREWFGNARPEAADDWGDGSVVLYATAYKAAGAGGEEAYQAIITAIVTSVPDAIRQARTLSFRFVDGRWRLTGEIAANLPQTAEAFLSGACDYCYDRWERWEG